MKLSIIIVPIVCLIGCSAPQAPPLATGTTIPGLSIPDTIDFGVVRAGVAKDTNIMFKNTGTDTIYITSQSFSNSIFQLSNSSQSKLSIAPGASQVVRVQFLPTDTSASLSYDTIRTANKTNIILLRGKSIPFSSEFPIAPKKIVISLTGVIGETYAYESPYTFSFYYDEPYDISYSHDSVYYFSGGASGQDYDYRGDEVDWWSNSTYIPANIDTNLVIKLLRVYYDYSYSTRVGGTEFTKSEVLTLHNIALTKTGNSYTAVASGPSIMSLVDTVYSQGDYPNAGPQGIDDNQPPMYSLIGFTDSAKLSITIK